MPSWVLGITGYGVSSGEHFAGLATVGPVIMPTVGEQEEGESMKIIQWNAAETAMIEARGELCMAVARAAMERNGLNFDQIERINNHYEDHVWGSNADRRYRNAAVNRAVAKVAANPLVYAIV